MCVRGRARSISRSNKLSPIYPHAYFTRHLHLGEVNAHWDEETTIPVNTGDLFGDLVFMKISHQPRGIKVLGLELWLVVGHSKVKIKWTNVLLLGLLPY